ncbi:TIGR03089 family protein [Amycolatopsis arida]|uniref:TIGR03089 family protein n=1 Tax=Amycolatopsis arida TaxID=587909 RepID=A0A1I5WMS8_9PSEU|nr:uncharacterized protein (TIGR03089 family) [Amycolatopsis arida]SFQ20881.1 TIGR03089 family protein [Amycolatopsis arida]
MLLGAWWCGAHVVREPAGARVAFVGPSAGADEGADVEAVVALDPLGRGLPAPPAGGAVDFLTEARLAGDDFTPLLPVPGDTPALVESTVDEVLNGAAARAAAAGIGTGDRILSTLDWELPEGVLAGLLAPLSAGAHLVQVTAADPAKLADRRRTERTTVDLLR